MTIKYVKFYYWRNNDSMGVFVSFFVGILLKDVTVLATGVRTTIIFFIVFKINGIIYNNNKNYSAR